MDTINWHCIFTKSVCFCLALPKNETKKDTFQDTSEKLEFSKEKLELTENALVKQIESNLKLSLTHSTNRRIVNKPNYVRRNLSLPIFHFVPKYSNPRFQMNVLVTGTPDCGKTTLCQILKDLLEESFSLSVQHLNISELVKQHNLHDGYDKRLATFILDEDKLWITWKKSLSSNHPLEILS